MTALGARRGRPGHGYYTDELPRALLNKSFDVGREVRDYPSEVKTVEYELENYPYITLDKAVRTVLNECTAALIMGCNGIAFNALKDCEGTLEDYEPLTARRRGGAPDLGSAAERRNRAAAGGLLACR
jgi:hypothetical protein